MQLRSAQILHLAFLASIFIYGGVIVYLRSLGTITSNPDLVALLHWPLAGVYLASLVLWRLVLKPRLGRAGGPQGYQAMVIQRNAFIESGAIYGVMLGLQGASNEVCMPFLVVAALLMLASFPTQSSYQRFCETGE